MTQEEINQKIEQWHIRSDCLTIYEYLGWTREEYAKWVETCDIPERFKENHD